MAIFFSDKQLGVVKLPVGTPFEQLREMEAIAVVNEACGAFNCLRLYRSQFIGTGNKEGAGSTL